MSTHTFSVLTSDVRRNPSILSNVQYEAAARTDFKVQVTVTEHDEVTTVTAAAA